MVIRTTGPFHVTFSQNEETTIPHIGVETGRHWKPLLLVNPPPTTFNLLPMLMLCFKMNADKQIEICQCLKVNVNLCSTSYIHCTVQYVTNVCTCEIDCHWMFLSTVYSHQHRGPRERKTSPCHSQWSKQIYQPHPQHGWRYSAHLRCRFCCSYHRQVPGPPSAGGTWEWNVLHTNKSLRHFSSSTRLYRRGLWSLSQLSPL